MDLLAVDIELGCMGSSRCDIKHATQMNIFCERMSQYGFAYDCAWHEDLIKGLSMLAIRNRSDTRLAATSSVLYRTIDRFKKRMENSYFINDNFMQTFAQHAYSWRYDLYMNIYMWDWRTEDDTRMLTFTVHKLGDNKQGNESKQKLSSNQHNTYWFSVANVVVSCLSPPHETYRSKRLGGVLVRTHSHVHTQYVRAYVHIEYQFS